MNRFYRIIIIVIILFQSCKTTKSVTGCTGPSTPGCMCTMDYNPVCGCDGKPYSNACMAACAGIKSWTEGACEK